MRALRLVHSRFSLLDRWQPSLHSCCWYATIKPRQVKKHVDEDASQSHHVSASQRDSKMPKIKPQVASSQIKSKLLPDKENIMTIPNALTMSRIILSPALGYLVIQESYPLACGLFLCVGLTDLLDGWIARNFKGQTSAFGSFLDPLADKILISVAFVSLSVAGLIPVPLTALILSRDAGLILAAFYVRYISLEPPRTLSRFFDATTRTAQLQPLLLSKVNTALQLGLVALSLTAPVFNYVNHPALQCLWWLTATTTVITGVQYMVAKDTFKILKEARSKSN